MMQVIATKGRGRVIRSVSANLACDLDEGACESDMQCLGEFCLLEDLHPVAVAGCEVNIFVSPLGEGGRFVVKYLPKSRGDDS